ncbi:MAG: type II toxin-antitoxin system VapC family toxin [Thermofilum sp.]
MRARFLDSSVFLHAYLKPKRSLTPREAAVKRAAQEVLVRVEEGEPVVTTVVHVSEVANVVEARLGLSYSIKLVAGILSKENIEVLPVEPRDFDASLDVAQRYSVSVNDALAYVKMKEEGVEEVYTFDKHFHNMPGVKVLPRLPAGET